MALIVSLLFADMAGMAAEGSQFDARQYDSKMNELYLVLFIIIVLCFTASSFAHNVC